jgi:hypothetical protein
MRRAGKNAKWAALTAERQATMENWLAEEKLTLTV